ncbi:hypothetical protein L804_05607 [Cryptococcus deuterogattii 2001/935-1]|nr:hypothetical protein L804_05607 [Cryptococcus deuterogattii 2001/935-1]
MLAERRKTSQTPFPRDFCRDLGSSNAVELCPKLVDMGTFVATEADGVETVQFTGAEIRAITETCDLMGGIHTTAHAYTDRAIRHAVENGIKGIEHGNLMSAETAKYMAERGIFYTPTLATSHVWNRHPYNMMLPPANLEKNNSVMHAGLRAAKFAYDAGVIMCYGSDMLGSKQVLQTEEFAVLATISMSGFSKASFRVVVESCGDYNGSRTRPEHARADLDVAGRFLGEIALRENAAELLAPCTDEEAKQVRRKADCIILPLLMLALIRFMCQGAGSIIFFGQLASVFPALFMMQRLPAGYVVSGNVLIWGLLICRFILGFFESISFPGYSLSLTSWYTRREQTVRTAVIFNTMSTIFNGLIASGGINSFNSIIVKSLGFLMRGLEAGSLVGLLLMYVFWAPYVVMIGVVNANTAGYTKKTIVYAIGLLGVYYFNIRRLIQPPRYNNIMRLAICAGVCKVVRVYLQPGNILASNTPRTTSSVNSLHRKIERPPSRCGVQTTH